MGFANKTAAWLGAFAVGLVHWRGVFWQTLHLAGGGGLYLLLWLVLARCWPVETFGRFNFLFAFISISGIFFDFGLDVLLTRFVACSKQTDIPIALLVLKGMVVLIFFPLFVALGMRVGVPGKELITFLLGVLALSLTALLNGVLRGMDRLDLEGRIGLGQKLIFTIGAVFGVIYWQQGILWVGQCYLVSHLLALGLTGWQVLNLRCRTAVPAAAFYSLLSEAWPLWGVGLLPFLARRVDIFFLEMLQGEHAVGIFSAAARLVDGTIVIGSAYLAAVFPRLVNGLENGEFSHILRRSALLLGLVGGGVGLLGAVLADPIVALLYGQDYRETVPVLKGLMLAVAIVFLADLLGQGFMARAQQGRYLAVLALGFGVTMAVSWAAIPRFGAMGAVYSYWAREIVLAAALAVLGPTKAS